MKIGASTLYGVNNKSVLESVEELEKAGFDTIELMYEFNNLIKPEEIIELKRKKLNFSMHCPFIGVMFTHLNPAFSKPQIKSIERSLEVAKKIGCSHYVMHGGFIPSPYLIIENTKPREFFINLFISRFKNIFQKYSDCGIKIVMENLLEREIGGQVTDIIEIKKAIPEMGFCFDVAHAEVTKQTNEIFSKLKIDHVHATDNNLMKDEHKVIGSGKIDYKDIINKLKDKSFDGKIILENLSFADCVDSFNKLKRLI
jgi:sugar phosphate isomerase/epimerase